MSNLVKTLTAEALITCGESGVVVHRPGLIDIDRDGRVLFAGKPADAPAYADRANIRQSNAGGLLMPGLVNTHAHGPMTLLRGVGDGLPLQRWLTEAIWPREGRLATGDVTAGMLVASIEMLTAGVTTSCEMYFADDELIDAVRRTGGRLMCTPGVVGVVHLDRFHKSDGRLAEIRALHDANHEPDGLIQVGVAPHSAYDLPLDVIETLAGLAREFDVPLHLHVAETEDEGLELEAAHGKRTVEILAERNVLDGHVLTAHSVWLSDREIELYAEHGTHVAHCPKSNLKLGSGIARLDDLLTAGVNVGIGTDGAASNDDLDLWYELQLAPLLARGVAKDPTKISSEQALLMATRDGARAVGFAETGTLTPGSWADIISIDTDTPAFTPIGSDHDLIDRLVWAGGSRYVTNTWVAGTQVVDQGKITTVDQDQALDDLNKRAARLVS